MSAETRALINQLNRIRLERNLSYASLASEIGINPGGLHRILNGETTPYDRTLHKIRRYLDAQPERQAAKRPGKTKAVA